LARGSEKASALELKMESGLASILEWKLELVLQWVSLLALVWVSRSESLLELE
jgi:hypothetical protein